MVIRLLGVTMEVRINVLLLIGIAAVVIMVAGLFLDVDIEAAIVGLVAGIVGLSGKLTDPPPNPTLQESTLVRLLEYMEKGPRG